jgi:hypothetical protein
MDRQSTPFADQLPSELRWLCSLAWSALVEAGTEQVEQISSEQALTTLTGRAAQMDWSALTASSLDMAVAAALASLPGYIPAFHAVWMPYVMEWQRVVAGE